jgi:peptidoglycan/LPS O-acetylase OafA/YrhL
MTASAERPRYGAVRASLAIGNLRAVVILLVLAFHAALAYLDFLPARQLPFDSPPFLWRAFPIIDPARSFGLDLFCAWLDVFLMSFFFLVSGLFAWTSLTRRGAGGFLGNRLLRLGLPFAVVILVVMPLALYPSYLESGGGPGIAAYWRHWRALPFWPSGPMWFLWLLLAGDVLAAGLYRLMAGRRAMMLRLSHYAREHPGRFLAGFVLLSALAYIAPALIFGASPWFQWGPFSAQLSRPAHYAVYFFAGVTIGARGIERGLLDVDGPLPRHWERWMLAALLLFACWLLLSALVLTAHGAASPILQALDALSFVLACFASCFCVLAAALRFMPRRWPQLEILNRNAYGMYLVHYPFVLWLQYALLAAPLPAIAKFMAVFAGSVLLSLGACEVLCGVPAIALVIGGGRRSIPARLRRHGQSAGLAD